ncbi:MULTISPECIES: outer membrane protein transport protein [Dysgonomonas]|uniref:Outer membrane protein beta-barrel domain-containing protein n=2 Tax=Dysgonomonas gadei TaxID=156974 RepID=F5J421_9BACT|nr:MULTISPECIES: outer membrane protein transport protein [Dysgonomonas]EGJ99592.1 hypothetical protein HMPREF9455_04088 [Dysgonomonas gadei ATCC BAA-286]MBF0649648.1 outer membrane protein transport protein [Dysgonomonas sp. GY75]
MLKSKNLLLIALLACIVGSLRAQTDSPYSRYGYGVLRDQAVGPSKAMGGVGYGLRNSQSANPLNPASYSRVDSLTFLFDIGVNFNSGKLSDGVNSDNKYSGGLDYITILVPLKKGLGLSFGIIPFSSVGYKFGSTETNGSVSYNKTFSGSGGLSQIYGGLGYSTPIKGLSAGANVSYLFGTLDHTRSLPALTGSTTYTSRDMTELSVKAAKFDIGLQYEMPIAKNKILTIGAVYSPKINSSADYNNIRQVISASNTLIQGDTTNYTGVDAGIPETYGLGFTVNSNNKLVFGADATYQRWSKAKYTSYMNDGLSDADRFNDRWKYSVGAEYMIDPYDRSFFKKIRFRGGVNYANSYLNVMDASGKIDGYKEYGATLGFGLPIRDNIGQRVSYININFEYKKLKPKLSNMISEEYFGVSLNVNINELWFFRRKVE